MRIIVNCLFFQVDTMGGMEVATMNLLRALADDGGEHTYIVLCAEKNGYYFSDFDFPNVTIKQVKVDVESRPARVYFEQMKLPSLVDAWRADLFFGPAHVLPLRVKCPTVLTIHDLHWMNLPDISFAKRAYLNYFVRRSCVKADRIIVDSEFTGHDLTAKYPDVSADKIQVGYIGIDNRYFDVADDSLIADALEGFNIEKPCVLSVGQRHRRKNIPMLVRAFAALAPEIRDKYSLVIVGGAGDDDTDLSALARELGIEKQLVVTGRVPASALPLLYQGADLFAYPSAWEGFGMPVAEAMASGTAVVCSNNTSLVEIAGDCCILSEPEPENFSRAMERVLSDPGAKKQMETTGRARARLFDWRKTAEIYLESFRKAVAAK